ncbi:hypothetical protein [Nocardia sp. NPDC004722]
MREVHRDVIPVRGAKSLVWIGGTLYDTAAGWRSIPLDGSPGSSRFGPYGDQFDAVVVSPRREMVALLASTGTKGLLLSSDGTLIREINRSYYQADMYRYPLALFTLPDGRTGLAHCPDEYNRLEIEVAATGERLTIDAERKPEDFFHSRLAVSPDGRYLMSAGWVWMPVDALAVYDLHRALTEPAELDSTGSILDGRVYGAADVGGACFRDGDVVIATLSGGYRPEPSERLASNMLARWSITGRTFLWRKQLEHPAGDVVGLAGRILSLYEHPRLYDATCGELIAEWPDLATGEVESSIVASDAFSGPARLAIDADHRRFAVTDGERVTVVHLG